MERKIFTLVLMLILILLKIHSMYFGWGDLYEMYHMRSRIKKL